MTKCNFEVEFKDKIIRRGSLKLIKPEDAILLIERSQLLGWNLCGLEGFFVGDDWVEPSQDNTLSFESINELDLYNSLKFFAASRMGSGIYFDPMFL